ncbi:MAG: transglutaminase family protein [Planctomycetota bacterium]
MPLPEAAPFFRQDPPVEAAAIQQLHKPFEIAPRSLNEVLALHPDQAARCDAARLNLLCATGLPGAQDLHVDALLHRLDVWSAWIATQTQANFHHFHCDPKAYDNSEPYWRCLTLSTVLQLHLGVRYEPRLMSGDAWDWRNSGDVLLHGVLGSRRTGSCPSLPVLLIAIGRRLGYPLRQVHAPAHAFARWDSADHESPAWRTQINLECHGHGLASHPDDHYHAWPVPWTPAMHDSEVRRARPQYLRSLEPAEELASFLLQRVYVLLAHGRGLEAVPAAQAALKLAPDSPAGFAALDQALGQTNRRHARRAQTPPATPPNHTSAPSTSGPHPVSFKPARGLPPWS